VTEGRRLVLLRHGRTSWNAVGRAQGHADVELDDLGHAQARAAAVALAALRPAAIWTSDLARARQTCGYLERATGLSAKPDERLREFDVGARQGQTLAEARQAFPDEYAAWLRSSDIFLVSGAESAADVEARMVPALREFFASLHPGDTGIAVTHGACLKVGMLGLLGWPRSQAPSLRGIDNCAWVTLAERELDGPLCLEAYNRSAGPTGDGATEL
jgi:glucosyl-3-phosphoglycerate phosphatase